GLQTGSRPRPGRKGHRRGGTPRSGRRFPSSGSGRPRDDVIVVRLPATREELMPRITPTLPELALPVASLAALRRALNDEVGPDTAARVLQQAGYAAGAALFPLLAGRAGNRQDTAGEGVDKATG